MRVSEAFPSNYIKAADLQGRSVKVVIKNYAIEKIGDDSKPVIYFEGKEKGLVCNKTNANNIAYAYGDDMDEWKGAEVELFTAMVDFQGKTVEAVRVRIPQRKPAQKQQASANSMKDMADDQIPF